MFLDADHPEDATRLPLSLDALARGADLRPRGARGMGRGRAATCMRTPGGEIAWSSPPCGLLFGRRFEDLPPFRVIGMAALRRLAMDDRNWGWTLQMQMRAVRQGLKIVEVDAPHEPRSRGRSKISGCLGMSARVGAKMFYTLAREGLRGR